MGLGTSCGLLAVLGRTFYGQEKHNSPLPAWWGWERAVAARLWWAMCPKLKLLVRVSYCAVLFAGDELAEEDDCCGEGRSQGCDGLPTGL